MIKIPHPDRLFQIKRLALAGVALLMPAQRILAAADGIPHLDPTNNNNGTNYAFTMPGASKSMDPALSGTQFAWKGTMTVFQDAGVADFDADMALDVNGDGISDRSLGCSGMVGNGRFSLRCTQNDGQGELRFLVTGRAVTLDSGKLALRHAAGRGNTDVDTFVVAFQATEE